MNLAELILSNKGRRSFAEISRDCGGAPTDKRIQQLSKTPPKNFPDPGTITALARGLRVPPATVVLASAQSLGIDVRDRESELVRRLPVGTASLSNVQIEAVLDTVRAFVDTNSQIDGRRDGDRDAWDRALANRGGYPPGKHGAFLLTIWDDVNEMLYTEEEAIELGIIDPSEPTPEVDDPTPPTPEQAERLLLAAEIMRERAKVRSGDVAKPAKKRVTLGTGSARKATQPKAPTDPS